MYFVRLGSSTGKLALLWMAPMQMKNFRLNRASQDDARWLGEVLNREGKKFGTRVILDENGALKVMWEENNPGSRKRKKHYESALI
jgi:poly-gamma-glutamate synthesis protein (capsule biosynthesis protein)